MSLYSVQGKDRPPPLRRRSVFLHGLLDRIKAGGLAPVLPVAMLFFQVAAVHKVGQRALDRGARESQLLAYGAD